MPRTTAKKQPTNEEKTSKKIRKLLTVHQKERKAVGQKGQTKKLNEEFEALKKLIPNLADDQSNKVSRLQILQLAMTYIKFLRNRLEEPENRQNASFDPAPIMNIKNSYCARIPEELERRRLEELRMDEERKEQEEEEEDQEKLELIKQHFHDYFDH